MSRRMFCRASSPRMSRTGLGGASVSPIHIWPTWAAFPGVHPPAEPFDFPG